MFEAVHCAFDLVDRDREVPSVVGIEGGRSGLCGAPAQNGQDLIGFDKQQEEQREAAGQDPFCEGLGESHLPERIFAATIDDVTDTIDFAKIHYDVSDTVILVTGRAPGRKRAGWDLLDDVVRPAPVRQIRGVRGPLCEGRRWWPVPRGSLRFRLGRGVRSALWT
ncbi:hypothetical protein [Chelatococcus reniformis]|uniref:hypothetical protein n=1 Tax=Chelatococcus reniformis TaxID=1494448 RepID=UPI001AEDCC6D|nr:hypothetical protein [Chelatococcus reniformis]